MKLSTKTQNILYTLLGILTIILLGSIYLVTAWWLMSGIIGTAFTIGQTARAIAILFLTVSTVRFINSIKINNG